MKIPANKCTHTMWQVPSYLKALSNSSPLHGGWCLQYFCLKFTDDGFTNFYNDFACDLTHSEEIVDLIEVGTSCHIVKHHRHLQSNQEKWPSGLCIKPKYLSHFVEGRYNYNLRLAIGWQASIGPSALDVG